MLLNFGAFFLCKIICVIHIRNGPWLCKTYISTYTDILDVHEESTPKEVCKCILCTYVSTSSEWVNFRNNMFDNVICMYINLRRII